MSCCQSTPDASICFTWRTSAIKAWTWKILGALVTAAFIWGGGSLIDLRERVSVVEADGLHRAHLLNRIEDRLERLEGKVDRLLERPTTFIVSPPARKDTPAVRSAH